jgi:hypothetical protein
MHDINKQDSLEYAFWRAAPTPCYVYKFKNYECRTISYDPVPSTFCMERTLFISTNMRFIVSTCVIPYMHDINKQVSYDGYVGMRDHIAGYLYKVRNIGCITSSIGTRVSYLLPIYLWELLASN